MVTADTTRQTYLAGIQPGIQTLGANALRRLLQQGRAVAPGVGVLAVVIQYLGIELPAFIGGYQSRIAVQHQPLFLAVERTCVGGGMPLTLLAVDQRGARRINRVMACWGVCKMRGDVSRCVRLPAAS